MTNVLDETLAHLETLDHHKLKYEIRRLRAVYTWALERCGVDYRAGDRVVIAADCPRNNGWAGYREALARGATATVREIEFNEYSNGWQATIVLDREWANGREEGVRYWHGPAADTPDGMQPPSAYDQEHHPEGRKHTFSLRAEWLRKADKDQGPSVEAAT